MRGNDDDNNNNYKSLRAQSPTKNFSSKLQHLTLIQDLIRCRFH